MLSVIIPVLNEADSLPQLVAELDAVAKERGFDLQTIIVDDVNSDPRYLACSLETKSEIVVPIMRDGQVLGEIDIDSDRPAAFGADDQKLLETVAAALAKRM